MSRDFDPKAVAKQVDEDLVVRLGGLVERLCEHGVGHPIGHTRGHLAGGEGVHGCDGCCREYLIQSVEEPEID